MQVVLKVDNVSLDYDANDSNQVEALKDIFLEVEQGEFLTVLGPSGCGKSTLLDLLAGFIKPTQGCIYMHDEVIQKPSYKRGVVFQSPTLYPWLSIKDNISFGLRMRKVDPKITEQKTMEYIQATGLSGFEERFPYELSGGMQQRASVARAMVNEPEVILMDEPFGALDPLTRKNMQDLVLELHQKTKCTIVLVTHDVKEALRLGTRVVVLKKRPGEIVYTAKPPFDEEAIIKLLMMEFE